jgi:hypothetical protein
VEDENDGTRFGGICSGPVAVEKTCAVIGGEETMIAGDASEKRKQL